MGINTMTNDFQEALAGVVNDGLRKLPVCNVRISLMLTVEKVTALERSIVEQEKATEEKARAEEAARAKDTEAEAKE